MKKIKSHKNGSFIQDIILLIITYTPLVFLSAIYADFDSVKYLM